MPKFLPRILATKRPKTRLLWGVQKSFWLRLVPAYRSGTAFVPRTFCVQLAPCYDLLCPLPSLYLFLYFTCSYIPSPPLQPCKSSQVQIKSHYFFTAPIPTHFLTCSSKICFCFYSISFLRAESKNY